MWGKLLALIGHLKMFGKLAKGFITLIKWVTPQGMHLLFKLVKHKGGAQVNIEDVSFSEESDHGFKATLTLSVESKNKEALTTVKTEIINSPHKLIKD